jgi:hypothetical protein
MRALISFLFILLISLKAICQTPYATTGTNIGNIAPDISLPNPNGEMMSLSSLRGKVVMVHFWSDWSSSSRNFSSGVLNAYKKLKDRSAPGADGFEPFSVYIGNDKADWTKAIYKDGLEWKYHVSDLKKWKSEASKAFDVHDLPASFLIDPSGIIVAKDMWALNVVPEAEKIFKKYEASAPKQQPTSATTNNTNKNETAEQIQTEPVYRGSGDPLKGLNVTKAQSFNIGNYYALIIGIDNYKGTWQPLKNAVNDAKTVEALLQSEYKFDFFHTLYNEQATRKNIIKEFEWLVSNVKETDNVLIFYSGHGEYKRELEKGFWVPVDAGTTSISEFVSNNDIQTFLAGIKSKHTLLVSDACFSGDVFRGQTVSVPFENSERYYKEVHGLTSRQAITSGGIEPVMDGGKDGHSVFSYYFIKSLINNKNKYLDASQVFDQLKIPVFNNSEQSPKLSPIKNTGDEGGQFIFIKK